MKSIRRASCGRNIRTKLRPSNFVILLLEGWICLRAWPVVTGFRPTSLDACVNYSQEGFALHPEWRKDPNFAWNSTGNQLLWILRTLQDEPDNHYQGRF